MSFDRLIKDFQEFLIKEKRLFEENFGKPLRYDVKIDDFEVLSIVGMGSISKVVLARLIDTSESCAIKITPKKTLIKYRQVEHARNEKHVLEAIRFPFITRLLFFFQDNSYLYYAMSFVKGIGLNTRLEQLKKFPEDIAKFYVAQIILALEYLHFLDLIYRNVRPECVIISHSGYVKMIDFKLCKRLDERKERTYTICGSPEYLSPEVILSRGYGKSCDYWSLGILMYELCSGYLPFLAKDHVKLYEKIIAGKFKMPNSFSKELVSLIKELLQTEVFKRIGCSKAGFSEIKSHSWFSTIEWSQVLNRKMPVPYKPEQYDDPIKDKSQPILDLQTVESDPYAGQFANF